MKRITNSVVDIMIRNKAICCEDRDVYFYCVESFLEKFVVIALCMVIGIIFSRVEETLLFWLYFMFLRSYAGGIHMKTQKQCFVVSVLVFIICVLLSTVIVETKFEYQFVMMIITGICICAMSPVECKNKRLAKSDKKRNKIRCLLLESTTIVLMLLLRKLYISTSIFCVSNMVVIISQIIGVVQNNMVCYNECKRV